MKNRKRPKTLAFGMIFMLSSTFVLGSAKPIDPILLRAEEITRQIFLFNESEIEETVREKEEQQYIVADYLKGLDDSEDYILVQRNTGGYAIFEKESMELIEYSDLGGSPYGELRQSQWYYAGPANYFAKDKEKVKNIQTGACFSNNEMPKVAKALKEKISVDRQKRKERQKQEENKKQATGDIVSSTKKKIDYNHVVSLEAQDPGPTGEDTQDANDYTVMSRKYIDGHEFFIRNISHGYNRDGTCTSIAAQLLLAYNNWRKDGRIISLNPAQIKGNERFLEADFALLEAEPYNSHRHMTTSSDNTSDEEVSFYEVLKDVINPYARAENEMNQEESDLNDGANTYKAMEGIELYLEKYAIDAYEDIQMDAKHEQFLWDYEDYCTVLTREIDNNRPAIGSIHTYHTNDAGDMKVGGHSVVVYGYQTILFEGQSLNGYIAHFGWRHPNNNYYEEHDHTHKWFNATWVKGYLTLETSHRHSDYYLNSEQHILKCSICERTATTSTHNYSSHQIRQNQGDEDQVDSSYHNSSCGCGYITEQRHNFSYNTISQNKHYKRCGDCSYGGDEDHIWKSAGICLYCGEKKY